MFQIQFLLTVLMAISSSAVGEIRGASSIRFSELDDDQDHRHLMGNMNGNGGGDCLNGEPLLEPIQTPCIGFENLLPGELIHMTTDEECRTLDGCSECGCCRRFNGYLTCSGNEFSHLQVCKKEFSPSYNVYNPSLYLLIILSPPPTPLVA